ncbi:YiiD C-terminal domain-containing protein [Brevundimonas sp. SPF441]|uniref:YiiD C-terminal domain-containing protein n=1 Tax=Brevundimonas sp. SPF441 TaxID=2663795 RepID=UPI00129D47ED|nr:thioesterase [Brevundimonas sp. SPF441]
MEIAALEQYLHHQIPLSAAMNVTVSGTTPDSVILGAPLEPNINHKSTAFGGSLSTLGILAAWSLVHLRLLDEGEDCEVVIQSNQMEYHKPVVGPFIARSALAVPTIWPTFVKTLRRRKLARIEVYSEIIFNEDIVGKLTGRFVAFLQKP